VNVHTPLSVCDILFTGVDAEEVEMNQSAVIVRDPEILGGTPVFAGTRVPIQTLLDYLAAGDSVSEFLDQYPSVQPEQVTELLEYFHEVVEQVA
jgi:uncharacterized protein (DUF433 family)